MQTLRKKLYLRTNTFQWDGWGWNIKRRVLIFFTSFHIS
jgi:hypothetical protein